MADPLAYPTRQAALDAPPRLDVCEPCDTFKHDRCRIETAPTEIKYGGRKGQWSALFRCDCPCRGRTR